MHGSQRRPSGTHTGAPLKEPDEGGRLLGRNVVAGLGSAVWTTLVGLAVVPLYLRFLGVEAYGVIGLLTTLQAIMQVFDFGLTPTVNREVARCAGAGDIRRAGSLLHTLAMISWLTAALIALALVATAPVVGESWLRSRALPRETLVGAVALMGLNVACRWPAGVYLGALMGAERLPAASALAIGATALSSLGGVAVLAFLSPTLTALFAWQAAAGLFYTLAARSVAWRAVGREAGQRFDRRELQRTWRFSAGMSGIALYGLAFSNLDKVLLSRLLPLDEFGQYMIATAVASGLYVVVIPVYNAVFPRFSALLAEGAVDRVAALYRRGAWLLGAILFPATLFLFVSGEDLLGLWTGNAALAAQVTPVMTILALGSAIHGVMYMQYALQLAYGATRLVLAIYSFLIVLQVPFLFVLARSLGAFGGGVAWLLLHVLYAILGTGMTHRRLLPGIAGSWLLESFVIPFGISLAAGLAGREALLAAPWPTATRLAFAVALSGAATLLSVALHRGRGEAMRDVLGLRREGPRA